MISKEDRMDTVRTCSSMLRVAKKQDELGFVIGFPEKGYLQKGRQRMQTMQNEAMYVLNTVY